MELDDAPEGVNDITGAVIDAAIEVHAELGPGLLERTYRLCLAALLRERGLRVAEEVALPVEFRGMTIPQGLRLD